jgi:hypothetical protein
MFKIRNILFLFVFILLIFSCNKDENGSIPVVDVLSPAENDIFSISDTIPVIATIRDERLITNVQVVLVNEDFTPVAREYNLHPNSNSYDLDLSYVIDGNSLESGTYYILVKAKNESKFKNVYREIEIKGEPLRLEKILVVTGEGEQHISVSGIDSSHTVSLLFNVDVEYAASCISSQFQQFYLAGKTLVDLRTFSLDDNSAEWDIPLGMTPPIHNDNCLYADEYLFVTYNSLYIRGYDNNGDVVFTTNVTSHDKPGAVFRLNDYVLVDMQKQNSAGSPELVTYYVESGIEMQTRQTQFEVVSFFRHTDKKVFITANNSNTGQLFSFNIEPGVLEHLSDLTGKIVSSDIIDANRILLGTESDIYIYDYSTMQLVQFMADIEVVEISYDALNSDLYLSSSTEVKKYKFPEMMLENTYSFGDTIKNVHLLYNR